MKRRDAIAKTLIGGSALLAGCSSKEEETSGVPAIHTKKKMHFVKLFQIILLEVKIIVL